MTEVGGEARQRPLHIGALSVPVRQPVDGKSVPERVEAEGPARTVRAVDSRDVPQLGEREVDRAFSRRRSVPVCKNGRVIPFRYRAVRA